MTSWIQCNHTKLSPNNTNSKERKTIIFSGIQMFMELRRESNELHGALEFEIITIVLATLFCSKQKVNKLTSMWWISISPKVFSNIGRLLHWTMPISAAMRKEKSNVHTHITSTHHIRHPESSFARLISQFSQSSGVKEKKRRQQWVGNGDEHHIEQYEIKHSLLVFLCLLLLFSFFYQVIIKESNYC